MELRQAADQVTAKNAELLRLNRDNGRLLEQATHQQQALTSAEREHRKTSEELEALRVLPAQVASLERRTAQAMVDAVGLKSRQDYAQSQLEQARRELHDAELEGARTQARLEGMQAAWAQRSTISAAAEPDVPAATHDIPLK